MANDQQDAPGKGLDQGQDKPGTGPADSPINDQLVDELVKRLAPQLAPDLETKVVSRMRSYIDKREQSVNAALQQLDGFIKDLKAANVDVPPNVEAQMRAQAQRTAEQQANKEFGPQAEGGPGQAQPPQPEPGQTPPQNVDPITAAANAIQQEAGVWIDMAQDPEASQIVTTTAREFLASVQKAVDAKGARIQRERANKAAGEIPSLSGGHTPPTHKAWEGKKGIDALEHYFDNK